MKNTVEEIIRSFTKEEFREFRYFLGRHQNILHDREDLKIVDLIRKDSTAAIENKNAFNQTKNRVKKHLELFAIIENAKQDKSSRVHHNLEVAKYLFRKNLYNQAWDYLAKAERLAVSQQEYELLNYIYYIQISYSYNIAVIPPATFSIADLLKKREQNLDSAQADGNANAAYAQLTYEIHNSFTNSLEVNVDEIVSKVYNNYDLIRKEIHHDQLKLYFKIVNIVCRILREKRDYKSLKAYAVTSYELVIKNQGHSEVSPEHMLYLLDMACIGSLRSKDYVVYEKFLHLYAAQSRKMQSSPDEFSYHDFIPTIDIADLYICTNRLELGRQSLLALKKKYNNYKDSTRIYFFLRMNLIGMHFNYNEFKICIDLYNQIIAVGEKAILNELGLRFEIILLTNIYAAVFHYENDDGDYAYYLLGLLKRKYSKQFKESPRELKFIKILEKMINDASYTRSKSFSKDCRNFIAMKTYIPCDNEYISLNAWLMSKHEKREYYDCFLELVS